MDKYPLTSSTTKQESIDIIEVIRKLRNDLIKDFLDERTLIAYLSEHYRIMELSNIKLEFIKKELKEMLITPVDINMYNPIIEDFKATGSAALSEGNEKIFYNEISAVLKKYIYY